jgi:hypothetical protein
MLVTYTWSSNWDNLYGTGSQVFATYGPQDNTNVNGGEYARSINSVPNRVTTANTYVLPVGQGQRFLGSPSGFGGHLLDQIVGGWTVNYEQIIQNGVPMTIVQTDLSSSTYGSTSYGGSYQRPTYLGDMHNLCYSGKPQSRLGTVGIPAPGERAYLNYGLLTATLPYQYGNVPRSLPCRVPGSDTATASLNKTFHIHEKWAFQFRAEALNLWNTPQFAAGSSGTYTLAVTGTGVNTAPTINSTQTIGSNWTQIGFSRIIQMGGRLTF